MTFPLTGLENVCASSGLGHRKYLGLILQKTELWNRVSPVIWSIRWQQPSQWEVKGCFKGGHLSPNPCCMHSVSNKADQSQGGMILHLSAFGGVCRSFGISPRLYEHPCHHTGTFIWEFIHVMMSPCFIRQPALVGLTGKGKDSFTWVWNSVHSCESHRLILLISVSKQDPDFISLFVLDYECLSQDTIVLNHCYKNKDDLTLQRKLGKIILGKKYNTSISTEIQHDAL